MQFEAQLKLDHYLDIDIMGMYIVDGDQSQVYDDFYNSIFKCTTIFEVNATAEGLNFHIYEVKDLYLQTDAQNSSVEDSDTETLEIDLTGFTKDVKIERINSDSPLNLLQLSSVEINLTKKTIEILFVL